MNQSNKNLKINLEYCASPLESRVQTLPVDCPPRLKGVTDCVAVVPLDVRVAGVRGNPANAVGWEAFPIKTILKLVHPVWGALPPMKENPVADWVTERKAKGVDAVPWCDRALLVTALVRVLAPSSEAPRITVGCVKALLPKFNFIAFILNRERKKINIIVRRHIKWQLDNRAPVKLSFITFYSIGYFISIQEER